MGYKTTSLELGTRYGRLETIEPVELRKRPDGRNRAWVKLRCDCGEIVESMVCNLKAGNTSSCGCFRKEAAAEMMTTHGFTAGAARNDRPRIYRIWRGVRQRCTNSEARNYRWYGAKGIGIAPEWDDFAVFHAWAQAAGYFDGAELDRKDSDKDYSPDNCRWVTKKQNLRNRDHCWSDELDARLVEFSAESGCSPYDVIAAAVAAYLGEVS
jgi:hypothetical protein